MKIKLNRIPYMCPVMQDHLGQGSGHYIFDNRWLGYVIDFQKESEDDRFWRGKVFTFYEGKEGWMQVELIKECFEVFEE